MKKLFILLLLLIPFILQSQDIGGDYYVSTTGSDANPGTYAEPFATWQKAFDVSVAGDTTYIRGGVYYPTTFALGNSILLINPDDGYGHNGAPGNPICYFNYPGEEPILDCRYMVAPGVYPNNRYMTALRMYDAHWINWRGLTIRNVYQREANVSNNGIGGFPISNMTFERMTVHNIGAMGWYMEHDVDQDASYDLGWDGTGVIPYDTTRYINCDTYQCCDTLPINDGQTAGNMADGFKTIAFGNSGDSTNTIRPYISYEGCRAWHCSDDGFDLPTSGAKVIFNNNWSFNHSYPDYDFEGNGLKLNGGDSTQTWAGYWKEITNNIFFNNDLGIYLMDGGGDWFGYQMTVLTANNFIYRCKWGIYMRENVFNDPSVIDSLYNWEFYNNIIYGTTQKSADDRYMDVVVENYYIESNNTWDYAEPPAIGQSQYHFIDAVDHTVTDADFVELDSATIITELTSPRHSDGSLPDITFSRLAEGSDLIGTGTDVGMSATPDLGVDWAYLDGGGVDSTATDITNFVLDEQTGYATINTTAHTVAIEVAYGTTVTALEPTITMDYGATISPTSGAATNFTSPVVYTVTALDGETEQEWTVTVTVAATPEVVTVTTSIITTYNAYKATLVGAIVNDANSTITAAGFVWGTTESPTILSGNIIANGTRGESSFSNVVSGLRGGTTYHFRAFATNSTGTAYGSDVSLTTPDNAILNNSGKVLMNGTKYLIY